MTRIRNVGGKITETTGGNETLHAGKDIIYNASKAINIKGNNGVVFGQPGQLTDLRITKLEGPYDETGKLVSEIRVGQSYSYLATPTRTPTASEVLLLKWAAKIDDGEITEIRAGGVHNQLSNGKITVGIRVNSEFKNVKIYAYFKAASESVSVSATGKSRYPMLVLQGSRRKGKNRENTGTALDMLAGDYPENAAGFEKLRKQLYDETYNLEAQDGWFDTPRADNAKADSDNRMKQVKEYCNKSDDELFRIFKSEIQGIYSSGKIETVAGEMVDRMKSNSGGEYTNKDLTDAVIAHGNSKTFIAAVKKVVDEYVKEKKGEISDLEITDDGKGKLYDKLVRDGVDNPKFSDWFSGLGITINDVWAYQIYITDYKVNGSNYEMKLEYIYYDHFGLDYPDIQKYDKSIFYSWFVLQHFKGYKPFITKLDIVGPLNGTF
ncbi:DUF3289 family protein [Flavobacterium zepuense]|uniref:DUF3289 family protein n=1 Tax=Flavobacterium zepuense TaxID=2593302 RepID=A0A552V5A5_9FLAO|nr:DUF3289 family protein [Flavobacterium zepuense]TRW25665.1 DUF3289 family protein [Flavobacterium zepuense]